LSVLENYTFVVPIWSSLFSGHQYPLVNSVYTENHLMHIKRTGRKANVFAITAVILLLTAITSIESHNSTVNGLHKADSNNEAKQQPIHQRI